MLGLFRSLSLCLQVFSEKKILFALNGLDGMEIFVDTSYMNTAMRG